MQLEPITRHQNLSDEVTERVVRQILSGTLKPGDRLPTEPELCQSLGVGRTSLREGLRPLALLGLIDIRPGEGTFVSQNPAEFFAKPLTWGLLIGEQNVSQLIEARELIELGVVVMATRRGSDDEIQDLADLLVKMEASVGDPAAFIDHDLAFHVKLADMSRNAVLARLVLSMVGLLRPWMIKVAETPGDAARALHLHGRILDAIRRGDVEMAKTAMAEHTQAWQNQLAAIIKSKESWA
ncbi:MAG: FadR family transcriptional regulator [Chloroflexi bacterium]|nr:FadR family transcriptional regulator [Chloroflexota bacterium]MCL5108675.1 FadR family transcriptional regulator [Chloroflexota bacterium]